MSPLQEISVTADRGSLVGLAGGEAQHDILEVDLGEMLAKECQEILLAFGAGQADAQNPQRNLAGRSRGLALDCCRRLSDATVGRLLFWLRFRRLLPAVPAERTRQQ